MNNKIMLLKYREEEKDFIFYLNEEREYNIFNHLDEKILLKGKIKTLTEKNQYQEYFFSNLKKIIPCTLHIKDDRITIPNIGELKKVQPLSEIERLELGIELLGKAH